MSRLPELLERLASRGSVRGAGEVWAAAVSDESARTVTPRHRRATKPWLAFVGAFAAIITLGVGVGMVFDGAAPAPGGTSSAGSVVQSTLETTTTSASDTSTSVASGAFQVLVDEDRRTLNEREDYRASCMAGYGFEYVPIPPDFEVVARVGLAAPHNYDLEAALEEAREFGLGMFHPQEEAAWLAGQTPPNPNDQIRADLGPEELEAYAAADIDCSQGAEAEYPTPTYPQQIADLLGEMIEQYEERFDADPRIVAADQAYRICLAEAGITSSPTDSMKQRFTELTGLDYDDVGPDRLDEIDPTALDQLRAEERVVADANAYCLDDLHRVRDQVALEIEQAVVEAHPEVLELLGVSE